MVDERAKREKGLLKPLERGNKELGFYKLILFC
jgi:hypothetical protein